MVSAPFRKNIVVLNGSPRPASRTFALVDAIGRAIGKRTVAEIKNVHLSEAGPHLLSVLSRDQVSDDGEAILRTVETADVLVVGTPVYRASLAGALKHVFDLIDRDALIGRTAVLAATGGTALHGLVGEHQLRPLLSFFRVFTTPTFVYATEDEFTEARQPNEQLLERVERSADEAVHLVSAGQPAWATRQAA